MDLKEALAKIQELETKVKELSDTVDGYRGRQSQLEKDLSTAQAEREEALKLHAGMEKEYNELSERLPELERAQRNAEKLVALADHPDLLANEAMRKLVLATDLSPEELKETLEGANTYFTDLFSQDVIGKDGAGEDGDDGRREGDEPEPEGDAAPPADSSEPPESSPPQTPPQTGSNAGFGDGRTLEDVNKDIMAAVQQGDTQRIMALMSEQMQLNQGDR